jgi:hypothetical protein
MNNKKSNFLQRPWNPNSIFGLFFVLTTILVAILLGLNWKPLGKPEWVKKTILLSLLINVGSLALAAAWVLILAGCCFSTLPMQLIIFVPVIAMSCNIGFALTVARLQFDAYKIYQNAGLAAIQDHDYNIRGALRFGLLFVLGSVLFGTFIIPLLAN